MAKSLDKLRKLGLMVPAGSESGGRTTFIDIMALGDSSTGARIRSLRKMADLTQEQVAALSDGELTQTDVSRLESFPDRAPLRHFVKVAAILNRKLEDILEDSPEDVR